MSIIFVSVANYGLKTAEVRRMASSLPPSLVLGDTGLGVAFLQSLLMAATAAATLPVVFELEDGVG